MHYSRMRTGTPALYHKGGSLSRREVPVQGWSLSRWEVSLQEGGLCPGVVSLQGGLCSGGVCQRDPLERDPPEGTWDQRQRPLWKEHGTRARDPLPSEGTWDQAARQEVTSYRGHNPVYRMTDRQV